jgi:hypothetical protein
LAVLHMCTRVGPAPPMLVRGLRAVRRFHETNHIRCVRHSGRGQRSRARFATPRNDGRYDSNLRSDVPCSNKPQGHRVIAVLSRSRLGVSYRGE